MAARSSIYTPELSEWEVAQGCGTSRYWSRTIRGIQYSFTAVLMPNGERRYFARRFNGYAGGPRFACAWTPCFSYTVRAR